jgi:tetratricopeptide (TPR) repeat protein
MKSFMTGAAIILLAAGCATTPHGKTGEHRNPGARSEASAFAKGEALNHYLTSVILMNTGNYEGAIAEMRMAADLTPDAESLQVRLLAMYYRDKDYENAAVMGERALEADPENATLNIWLGRIYYQLDRIDDAKAAFQNAIDLDPDSTLGYEALAEVEEQSNDLVGAVEVYEGLIRLNPDSSFLYYRLGVNLLTMGDDRGAQQALEKALSLKPAPAPAIYMLGVIYLKNQEFDKAIAQFRAYLNENNKHTPSWENLAGAYVQKGDLKAALAIMKLIVESEKVNTRHHLYTMYLHLLAGDTRDTSLFAAPNGAPILGTLLQTLLRRQAGEPYQKGLASLDGLDSDLDSECTLYLNGIISQFGTENTAAFMEGQLRSLIAEETPSRTVGVVLGRVLLASEQNAKAKAEFERVLREFGPDKWVHYYLATVNDALGNSDETESHLRKCLQFDPDDPNVMNFLAYHLAEQNHDLGEARKLLERALLIEPENGFYLDSLGWVYYRLGEGAKAVELIERAIRNMPSDDGILRGHLGDAYFMVGDKEKAIAEWERAIRLDPSLEEIRKKLKKHGRGMRSKDS